MIKLPVNAGNRFSYIFILELQWIMNFVMVHRFGRDEFSIFIQRGRSRIYQSHIYRLKELSLHIFPEKGKKL